MFLFSWFSTKKNWRFSIFSNTYIHTSKKKFNFRLKILRKTLKNKRLRATMLVRREAHWMKMFLNTLTTSFLVFLYLRLFLLFVTSHSSVYTIFFSSVLVNWRCENSYSRPPLLIILLYFTCCCWRSCCCCCYCFYVLLYLPTTKIHLFRLILNLSL